MDKYLGFRGRIPRGRWWTGMITLTAIAVLLFLGVAFAFGLPLSSFLGLGNLDAAALANLRVTTLIIGAIVALATIYPTLSLCAQRLNDRDRPAGLVWLLALPWVLNGGAALAGLELSKAGAGGLPQPTIAGWAVTGVSGLVSLWAFIELGCLRGTRGRNRNGPDPLER